MKYVCDVCGWEYDEEEGYPEGGIALEQSGRMFRKILNAHYVMLEKISFQKLNRSVIFFQAWIGKEKTCCRVNRFFYA